MTQHKSHSSYFHDEGPLRCIGLKLSISGTTQMTCERIWDDILNECPHKVEPDGIPLGYRVNLNQRYLTKSCLWTSHYNSFCNLAPSMLTILNEIMTLFNPWHRAVTQTCNFYKPEMAATEIINMKIRYRIQPSPGLKVALSDSCISCQSAN